MQKNSYDCVFLREGKLEKVTLWIGNILSSGHLLAEGINVYLAQIKFHLKFTFYVMCMGVAYVYVYAPFACLMPLEAKRACQITWNWS